MNVFSHPVLLECLAAAYFPGRPYRIREAVLEGAHYRLLEIDGSRLITSWHFIDFLEPVNPPSAGAGAGAPTAIRYLPKVSRRLLTLKEWGDLPGPGDRRQASPLVDWSALPTVESFEALVKTRRSNLFADARRRRRRLEESVGPLQFFFEDPRPEVLEACLGWKSDQYVASGLPDAFRTGAHADFFRRLAGAGLLRVASLSAGGRLLAAHLGALEGGRFYYWIPAYDPELTFFSPGRLLLDFMLKESQARGGEFDFLIGDEDYKWHYATHVRVVEPAGQPPLRLLALRGARNLARRVRAVSPLAYAFTRRLRLRLGGGGSGGPAAAAGPTSESRSVSPRR